MNRQSAVAGLAMIASLVSPALADDVRTIHVASTFPLSLPIYAEAAQGIVHRVDQLTDGRLQIAFHDSGELAPPAKAIEMTGTGAIDAAWGTPGQFGDHDTAFELLSAIPFGPDTNEYMAWLYAGGGLQLSRDLFAHDGIYNVPCLVFPPEGSGWFSKEIRTVDDLKGLRVRYFGLGGRVLAKLGAIVDSRPASEIVDAMRRGDIDAAEYSLPSLDLELGLQKVARYYYFPGWHQQSTLHELYFNLNVWNALPPKDKDVIEVACAEAMRDGIARAEAMQAKALFDIRAQGVTLRRWSPKLLIAFEATWEAVAIEQRGQSLNFKRVYDSYSGFRENYAFWKRFSYLK